MKGYVLLGAFAKLRKAAISFLISVRLSTWNNLAPCERTFMKSDIWAFFEKSVEKFKFH